MYIPSLIFKIFKFFSALNKQTQMESAKISNNKMTNK